MGYKIPARRTDKVTFGPPWEGAEFEILLDASIGVLEKFDKSKDNDDSSEIFKLFVDEILVSWNLEDDNGDPIPCDVHGLKTLPMSLVTAIIEEYQRHQTEVPENLGETSISGNGSATQLTELATLSQSPQT